MKIEKYVKRRSECYEIVLEDGNKILLHEDLILKYELLLKKEIDSFQIDKLLKEQNNYIAYDKAIKYIARRMRSTYEIRVYLEKLEVDNNVIDEIIEKLINQGYLNDKEYSFAYVKDRINLSNDGPYKIINNLKQNKISDDIINLSINIFDNDLQYEKINKLISKQIKSNNSKSSYMLKQKIITNLINLGYDREIIISVLNEYDFNDSDFYKKEYDKLYNKLSKKYSGKELEYKIKQKLYQKGFRNE